MLKSVTRWLAGVIAAILLMGLDKSFAIEPLFRPPESQTWTEEDYSVLGRAANITGILGIEPTIVRLNKTRFGYNVGVFLASAFLTSAVLANFDIGRIIPGPIQRRWDVTARRVDSDYQKDKCNCHQYCTSYFQTSGSREDYREKR